MAKTYTLRLEENDLGQLLDGLRIRSESWRDTAEYLESGISPRNDFIIEESSDADEARSIAEHYDRIISTITAQITKQKATS